MTTLTTTPLRTTAAPAAQARGVAKHYGRGDAIVRALDGVDVTFAAGTFTAVMGPSGSGKSTLMHCLAGLDTVDAGTVHIGETDVTDLSERQRTLLRRERVGFVFQSFNLLPALTALENILLPLALAGRDADPAWRDRIIVTLGLAGRLSHTPAELSGGQQQRVAVARALITRPALVFADEPTGNLDSTSGGQLLEFLREAVDTLDQTIVMVTHDPAAASYADRVLFLADGRIVEEATDPSVDVVLDRMKQLDTIRKDR